MDAVAALCRRDRLLIGLALGLSAGAAWIYTAYEARRMDVSGVCACLGMKMGGPELQAWPATTLLPLFFMWTVMMVAMMLPSAAPMILTFAAVARKRRAAARACAGAAVFAAGYVVVWSVFSLAAAVAQWFLHRAALLSPGMASNSAVFGGALVLAAGLFQFTPWKRACLVRCQGPLEFIMSGWREGRAGAFAMGLRHGAYCAGCCWALMALLFVLGVMNVLWIAALTLLVAAEKMMPRLRWLRPLTGLLLTGWGFWILSGS